MKDLNKCCDESKCNNCAFNGLETFCFFAWNKHDIKFGIIIKRVRNELNELNELDEEVKECEK